MDNPSSAINVKSITMHKFGHLSRIDTLVADKKNSIDIYPQVQEITIFQSLFSPVIKVEMAIIDHIGLFVNFPLSGEEIIVFEYENVADGIVTKLFLAIEKAPEVNIANNNRSVAFMLNCTSIEGLTNSLRKVQKSYKGTTIEVAKKIFDEYINDPLNKVFTKFEKRKFFPENDTNNLKSQTYVIPNLYPFVAIDMLNTLSIAEDKDKYTFLFYQDLKGFHIKTIQEMIKDSAARSTALTNKYKYISNEIRERYSEMNNEERIISHMNIVKRHSTFQKLNTGYFNNVFFEINLAQKAVWSERTTTDKVVSIASNKFNTKEFTNFAEAIKDQNDESNRTKFVLTTTKEYDTAYPVERFRQRWGKDLISKVALSQVDILVTIPGTNRFLPGSMFYLDIPEIHGFNEVKVDDLISGYFLVVDVKHVIVTGGIQTTVLRLSKDSYESSIERGSRYA